MPLVKGQVAKNTKEFMIKVNSLTQKDRDLAIDKYCNKLEEVIFAAIRSITITIPPSSINVQGTPSAQTNIVPIVLKNVVS